MTPTQSFINTLGQTAPLATKLRQDFQQLQANLQQIITILTYPKTVADDLTKLSNALSTTSDLLSVVSVVPEVGEAASSLKNMIQVLQKEVDPARDAAVSLDSKVKPIRDALQKLNPILTEAIQDCNAIATNANMFLGKFNSIVACANSLPDGPVKQTSLNYLDQFSAKAEPAVSALNTAMSSADQLIQQFYSALQQLTNALNPLQAISGAVEDVLNTLRPITDVLGELQNALQSIKIQLPLPYPVEVTLYEIFEKFSSLIDLAMKPIQSLVDSVLSALNVQLPSIPGLGDLIHLNINLPSLPDLSGLLTSLENLVSQLLAAFKLFDLKCPPDKTA